MFKVNNKDTRTCNEKFQMFKSCLCLDLSDLYTYIYTDLLTLSKQIYFKMVYLCESCNKSELRFMQQKSLKNPIVCYDVNLHVILCTMQQRDTAAEKKFDVAVQMTLE